MAVTTTQVQQLYLAYFGRPAEQAGLTYWTSQTNANVTQISAAFAQSAEYTGVYGGLTRAQTVDTLYQNLFGRSAASNELNYWVNSTDVSVSNLALALVNGATGTDRLLLDTKAQYAATITTNAGTAGTQASVSSAYATAPVGANGANVTLAQYLLTSGNTANGYYSAANAVAKAAVSPVFVASDATNISLGQTKIDGTDTADFKGLSNGTVTLQSINLDEQLTLLGTNASTVTIQGSTIASTAASADGKTAATQIDLSFVTDATTTQFNTLNLSLSTAGTTDATNLVGVNVGGFSELTSINASSSSAGLVLINTTANANLASITTGSGADNVTVANTAAKAVALTVDTGAGNDTVTATAGVSSLTINTGTGADKIGLTTTADTAGATVINAGAGNDTVTLTLAASTATTGAHTVSVTLGEGNDVLNIASLKNLDGTFTTADAAGVTAANAAIQADLVKVTDFNGAQDKLNLVSGYAALDNVQLGQVSGAATLAEALTTVASFSQNLTSFVFGNNTYIYSDAGTTGQVDTGDGLIELTGFTGSLTAANLGTYTA